MAQLIVSAAGAAIGGAIGGPVGARIGWMIGSLAGAALFSEKQEGPKIEDGKFSSSIYGQPIPLNYGTMRHATQLAWWSGLIIRTEEVGGKGGGGAEVEKARMNLLLAVCEGPQAAVLRIWANGRLIATFNGFTYDVDEEVLPAGEVRVYLGTDTQTADPTYEAAVGSANAVPYRGTVMVAIDGLEGAEFGNRPPNIECEVAHDIALDTCSLDPVAAIDVQQAGLYNGSSFGLTNAAVLDRAGQTLHVVTDGADGTTRQIEAYSVAGSSPAFSTSYALPKWRGTSADLPDFGVTGLGWDPESGLVRIAAGSTLNDLTTPIEYILKDGVLYESAAKFTYTTFTWGDFPVDGEKGGDGAFYSVIYSIYPDLPISGVPAGEAGWWSPTNATIQYRLAHLMNGSQGGASQYAWHHSASDGRSNRTADVVYVPLGADLYGGGGFNIAWSLDFWKGYYDKNATVEVFTDADGTDATARDVELIFAPARKKVYVVTDFDGIASVDVSASGNPKQLAAPLTAYPATSDFSSVRGGPVLFSVWSEYANGLVIGSSGAGGLAMMLVDPDTMAVMARPCVYASETSAVYAPKDMEDGRFACIYGETQVALITGPGGTVTGQAITLREIVEDLCDRAGLPAGNLDATSGTDLVSGFKVARQTSARAAIDSLRPAYFFDMPEVGEQIVLTKRGAASVATIESGELGAAVFHVTRSDPEPAYELEHVEEQEIPRRLELTYVDAGADYDPGVQVAERQVGESAAPLQIEVPVSLTAEQAARIAWVNLMLAHASKNPLRIKLSHAYDALIPSNCIDVPHASGDTLRMRIEQITRARPLLEVDGVLDEQSVYTFTIGGVPRYQGPRQSGIGVVSATIGVLLDVPPLRDQDDALVLYAGMARDAYDAAWTGASLYKSIDGGASYSALYSTAAGATIGTTSGALGDWTGGNQWDTENTLTVVLTSGTFSSATDAAVLNGANAISVKSSDDWEIVQFVNAELVGTNTWELTRLLRGRKGTERCQAGHAVGDRVILLSSASLRTVDMQIAEVGAARQFKPVTSGQAVADATAQTLTLSGRSLMPLSPVSIAGSRDSGGDLTITWLRRSRIYADLPDLEAAPLDEPSESYEIDIYDGTSVVRTLNASSETVTYTAAQQTTDFGSAQSSVDIAVYQISGRIGRGHAGEATV